MEPDDDQFRMVCPKCGSNSFTVRRDQRAYVHKSQPFELVFSCRCGKQLFGDKIQEEYDRQKAEWDSRTPEKPKKMDDATLRKLEESRRREQVRKAMEYRRTFLAEKRRTQAEEERKRKEEEDRRWRDRVAKVESEHGADTTYLREPAVSRMSKPLYTTRTVAQPAVPARPAPRKSVPPPTTDRVSPTAKPAPKPARRSEQMLEFDDNHPHAEFMAYLVEGTFRDHFPDCTTPDVKDETLCVWPPCEKPRRKKSKYCSRECSNKNARWRHKMRKKRS